MTTAESVLEHHGVKGMKWGVRRAQKKLDKKDKKWEKSIYTSKGAVAVHNETATRVNKRLDVINNNPKYKDTRPLDQPESSKLYKDYINDYESAVNQSYSEAVSAVHGSSPSGKKKAVYVSDANGDRIEIKDVVVEHADSNEPDLVINISKNSQGLFNFANFAELEHYDMAGGFLEHYGVKGMKWGVRKERSAVEVSAKTTPGRKVKTSGGKHHAPHEDAIRAAKTRQQAKKSTTDSLSNKELQDLVTRMNLEKQYSTLNQNNVGVGKKLLRLVLGEVGDKEINQVGEFVKPHYGPNAASAAQVGVKVAKSAVRPKK